MAKVKCRVCENSDGKRCEIKNVKVAQNKSRTCKDFDYNPGKIRVKQKLEATYVPWHLRTRKEYNKHVKKTEAELANQNAAMEGVKIGSPDVLSRFRSSAPQEDA